jgi:hypothetical protein
MLRAYQTQVEIVSHDCIETYGGAGRLHDRVPHHQVPNRGIRTRGAAGAIHASRAATTAAAALAALSLSPVRERPASRASDARNGRGPSAPDRPPLTPVRPGRSGSLRAVHRRLGGLPRRQSRWDGERRPLARRSASLGYVRTVLGPGRPDRSAPEAGEAVAEELGAYQEQTTIDGRQIPRRARLPAG